ncbi:hypothetical protein V1478_013248 [Vespula squamosa]|uniref:Uncharacterized protein n=1 Tax=Vespula squamosa TaxID=30214 RepID=A0ABD2AAA3_VESSQ
MTIPYARLIFLFKVKYRTFEKFQPRIPNTYNKMASELGANYKYHFYRPNPDARAKSSLTFIRDLEWELMKTCYRRLEKAKYNEADSIVRSYKGFNYHFIRY